MVDQLLQMVASYMVKRSADKAFQMKMALTGGRVSDGKLIAGALTRSRNKFADRAGLYKTVKRAVEVERPTRMPLLCSFCISSSAVTCVCGCSLKYARIAVR